MSKLYLDGLGDIVFNEFSPGELAQATGLGIDMQRVWRKRGHLPAKSGTRASFTVQELMEIAIRYELSKLGVSPRVTEDAARLGAPSLLLGAFVNEKGPFVITGSLGGMSDLNRKLEALKTSFENLTGGDLDVKFLVGTEEMGFHLVGDLLEQIKILDSVGAVFVNLPALANKIVRSSPKPLAIITPTEP